jgi:hypothetical protein
MQLAQDQASGRAVATSGLLLTRPYRVAAGTPERVPLPDPWIAPASP